MAKKSSSASDIYVQLQKLSNEATKKTLDFNQSEANTARDWQKMMSDTSHQRETEDYRKAGLNPVLSINSGGAMSYTTSSASGQAENAAGAVAAAYGADKSAEATRAAAASSAAAQRYAANVTASAQRYAAAMAYENNRAHEKWQTDYMKAEYKEKIKLVNAEAPKNVSGLIWKWSERAGLNDAVIDSKATKGVVSFAKTALNNPSAFFRDNVKVSKNNAAFCLNKQGVAAVRTSLKQLGIKPVQSNFDLFLRFVLFGDNKAARKLQNNLPHRSNSARPLSYYGYKL